MKLAWLALACTACTSWPSLDPMEHGDGSIDPRLGTELARSLHQFRFASAYERDGLLVVYEEVTAGWHAVRVDGTGAVTELPAPPLEPGETLILGRTEAPVRAAFEVTRGSDVLVSVLTDAWTTLPALPASEGDAGGVLAHDGAVYAVVGAHLHVDDGSGWTEPVPAASDAMLLGGYDATTQWVLRGDGDTVEAVPIGAGRAVTGPAGMGALSPSAINGDAQRFQLDAGGRMWSFDGASFTAGDALDGTPFSAPGSPTVVVATDGTPSSTFTLVTGGTVGATALASFAPMITCACDVTTDPTCGCVPHTVDYLELRPSPDATRMAMTSGDGSDGYAVLAVRFLELPFAGDPFAP